MTLTSTPDLAPAIAGAIAAMLSRRAFATATPTGRVSEWTQPATFELPARRFARVELRVQYKPRGRYSVTSFDLPLN